MKPYTPVSAFVSSPTGFRLTFANGWTVSVQYKSINHCDQGKTTAEMAAFRGPVWFRITPLDEVKGYCSPEEVVNFLSTIGILPSEESLDSRVARHLEHESYSRPSFEHDE